ncbi:MAG: ferritin-like domain-containing protein, partial [Pyrinomonadaceae bacterium]
DALVVLAAGEWTPAAIAGGFAKVQNLKQEMTEGRRNRLMRLGFSSGEADTISALHTRNFM